MYTYIVTIFNIHLPVSTLSFGKDVSARHIALLSKIFTPFVGWKGSLKKLEKRNLSEYLIEFFTLNVKSLDI